MLTFFRPTPDQIERAAYEISQKLPDLDQVDCWLAAETALASYCQAPKVFSFSQEQKLSEPNDC